MGEPLKFDYYYGIEAEQFSFYRVPRLLIKDERFRGLSSDAKLLYGLMLDRMSLSMKNGWLDDENRAYIIYAVENIMEDLGCSKPTCIKVIKELDADNGIGLIEKKRRGLGKPDIIYVKNFASVPEKESGEKPANADVSTEVKNLYLIPAGNIPPNPSELLVSDQMMEAIISLQKVFDLIIFDGTPSDLVTDAIIISRYVDTTMIVTSYKQTKLDALEKIKKDIENVGGKIAGVVINKMPISQKEYNASYYYGSMTMKDRRRTATRHQIAKEEELKIERKKEEIKAKTGEILKQNRKIENKPRTSTIFDFEKEEDDTFEKEKQ